VQAALCAASEPAQVGVGSGRLSGVPRLRVTCTITTHDTPSLPTRACPAPLCDPDPPTFSKGLSLVSMSPVSVSIVSKCVDVSSCAEQPQAQRWSARALAKLCAGEGVALSGSVVFVYICRRNLVQRRRGALGVIRVIRVILPREPRGLPPSFSLSGARTVLPARARARVCVCRVRMERPCAWRAASQSVRRFGSRVVSCVCFVGRFGARVAGLLEQLPTLPRETVKATPTSHAHASICPSVSLPVCVGQGERLLGCICIAADRAPGRPRRRKQRVASRRVASPAAALSSPTRPPLKFCSLPGFFRFSLRGWLACSYSMQFACTRPPRVSPRMNSTRRW
jgi:hypothetical protein